MILRPPEQSTAELWNGRSLNHAWVWGLQIAETEGDVGCFGAFAICIHQAGIGETRKVYNCTGQVGSSYISCQRMAIRTPGREHVMG